MDHNADHNAMAHNAVAFRREKPVRYVGMKNTESGCDCAHKCAEEARPARMLTLEEVIDVLRTNRSTFSKWLAAGTAPRRYRVGRHLLFDPDEFAAWLAEHRVADEPVAAGTKPKARGATAQVAEPAPWDKYRHARAA